MCTTRDSPEHPYATGERDPSQLLCRAVLPFELAPWRCLASLTMCHGTELCRRMPPACHAPRFVLILSCFACTCFHPARRHDYDTHYTERYAGLPAENKKGYADRCACVAWPNVLAVCASHPPTCVGSRAGSPLRSVFGSQQRCADACREAGAPAVHLPRHSRRQRLLCPRRKGRTRCCVIGSLLRSQWCCGRLAVKRCSALLVLLSSCSCCFAFFWPCHVLLRCWLAAYSLSSAPRSVCLQMSNALFRAGKTHDFLPLLDFTHMVSVPRSLRSWHLHLSSLVPLRQVPSLVWPGCFTLLPRAQSPHSVSAFLPCRSRTRLRLWACTRV